MQISQVQPDSHKKHPKNQDFRKVYDNIHGYIRFQKRIWCFIDTLQFQKLRYIKQLGALSFVFPGATHTRFQHCLGTGHLAKTFINLLILNNPERYNDVTELQKKSAIFTVTLAGIIHDIGHGPFSHTFDHSIVKTKVLQQNSTQEGSQWSHQLGSQLIFSHIVKKYQLIEKQVITPDQVKRVINLIRGTSDGKREWEFQLISNNQTGIDVDKLDYFRRDAYYLGAKGVVVDHELLMNEARILFDDKAERPKYVIGYPSKYALQVNDIFYSRYKLYKTYYFNSIAKGVEFMVMDALNLTEPIFKFVQICRNIRQSEDWINKYVALTDGILERIEWLNKSDPLYKNFSDNITKAKNILLRLKQRRIYKFVREVQTSITLEKIEKLKNGNTSLQIIFNSQRIKSFIFHETSIPITQYHIAVTEAGYGFKHINPLDMVKFFRKEDENFNDEEGQRYQCLSEEEFRAENISILYTKAFAQRYAKLYVTNVDEINLENVRKINKAFLKYFDEMKNLYPECNDIFNHTNMGRTSFHVSFLAGYDRLQERHRTNNFKHLP